MLKRIRNISDDPDRNRADKRQRETHLPRSIGTVLEPRKPALEGLIDFFQGEPLPWATVEDPNATRVAIYNARQRPQSNFRTLSKIKGAAIKPANTPAVSTKTILYLITCDNVSDH